MVDAGPGTGFGVNLNLMYKEIVVAANKIHEVIKTCRSGKFEAKAGFLIINHEKRENNEYTDYWSPS